MATDIDSEIQELRRKKKAVDSAIAFLGQFEGHRHEQSKTVTEACAPKSAVILNWPKFHPVKTFGNGTAGLFRNRLRLIGVSAQKATIPETSPPREYFG